VLVSLLVLMAGFALGVNRFLDATRKAPGLNESGADPTEQTANFAVPGTMFVAQAGQLYSLHDAHFSALNLPQNGQWMQPTVIGKGGGMLAVLRQAQSSDLYQLDASGAVVKQLTRNAGKTIDQNHWVLWPRVGDDGNTVYVSYDSPKSGYNVDMAIWSGTLTGKIAQRRWTTPNSYTGGDVQPTPVAQGGMIYVQYSINSENKIVSKLVYLRRAAASGIALTSSDDDCNQPALSPDGTQLAMVCTQGKQSTRLVVAHLDGSSLSNVRTLVQGCLCASPVWAPDGGGVAYLAPDDVGHFQLWWIANAATTPDQTKQMTNKLDLDATSPPAWASDASSAPAPG
jgi:hypothetical protein